MTPNQKNALERLIVITKGESDQSRKVADFLLAWWNVKDCGAFNLTHLLSVDDIIAVDMIEVCRLIAESCSFPDGLGYKDQFLALVEKWRPEFAWWNSLDDSQRAVWLRRSKPFTPTDAYKEWLAAEGSSERKESGPGN